MSARTAAAAALAAIAAAAGLGAMPAPAGAGWRLDRPLESGPYGGFRQAGLAADAGGRLAAAWIAGPQRVRSALGSTRAGLGPRFALLPGRLPNPTPGSWSQAQVALDGAGRAAFAWGEPSAAWVLGVRERSGPRSLFAGSGDALLLADGTGGFWTAWGTRNGVRASRAPAGAGFGNPVTVTTDGSFDAVAPGRAGGLLAGYERMSRPRISLSVREIAPDGTPGPEQQLAAGRTVPDPDYPDEPAQDFTEVSDLVLAGNAAGDAVACWHVSDLSFRRYVRVRCSRRAPGGRFGRPADMGAATDPQVAVTAGGEALLAYSRTFPRGRDEDALGALGKLAFRYAPRGHGFGAPEPLGRGGAGQVDDLRLSANARGDALVTAMTGNGDAKAVVAATRRAGGRFGAWLPVGFGDAAAGAVDGAGRPAILVSHAGPQPSRSDLFTDIVGTETRLARMAPGHRPAPEVQITDTGQNQGVSFAGVFRERRYGFGVRLSTLRPCRLRVVWSVDRVNGRRLGLGGAAVLGARTAESSRLLGGEREVWVGVQGARKRERIQRRIRGRLSLRWVRTRLTVTATAPGSPQAADSAADTVIRNPGDRS